jgi:hypothetical protein
MTQFLFGRMKDCDFIAGDMVEECFGENNHFFPDGNVGTICRCGKKIIKLDGAAYYRIVN